MEPETSESPARPTTTLRYPLAVHGMQETLPCSDLEPGLAPAYRHFSRNAFAIYDLLVAVNRTTAEAIAAYFAMPVAEVEQSLLALEEAAMVSRYACDWST